MKITKNRYLSNVWNTTYLDHIINIALVIQNPSGNDSYFWKFAYENDHKYRGSYDTKKLAAEAAKLHIDEELSK